MAEEDFGEIPPEVPPDPYPDFWAGGDPPAPTSAASDAQPANAPQRGGGVRPLAVLADDAAAAARGQKNKRNGHRSKPQAVLFKLEPQRFDMFDIAAA